MTATGVFSEDGETATNGKIIFFRNKKRTKGKVRRSVLAVKNHVPYHPAEERIQHAKVRMA